jgi:hypothetical protein
MFGDGGFCVGLCPKHAELVLSRAVEGRAYSGSMCSGNAPEDTDGASNVSQPQCGRVRVGARLFVRRAASCGVIRARRLLSLFALCVDLQALALFTCLMMITYHLSLMEAPAGRALFKLRLACLGLRRLLLLTLAVALKSRSRAWTARSTSRPWSAALELAICRMPRRFLEVVLMDRLCASGMGRRKLRSIRVLVAKC